MIDGKGPVELSIADVEQAGIPHGGRLPAALSSKANAEKSGESPLRQLFLQIPRQPLALTLLPPLLLGRRSFRRGRSGLRPMVNAAGQFYQRIASSLANRIFGIIQSDNQCLGEAQALVGNDACRR